MRDAPTTMGAAADRRGARGASGGGTGGAGSAPVVVQPMRRRHLRAVVAIERECNPHPWSLSLFTGELRMPTSRHWVVATDGMAVLGFAGLMVTLDEGHITNLAVHPDARRRHVATRMLAAQFREAIDRGVKDITLEVRVSNEAARALYARFGFSPGGVRPGYYRDNREDALILWAVDIASPEGLARLERVEESLRTDGARNAAHAAHVAHAGERT